MDAQIGIPATTGLTPFRTFSPHAPKISNEASAARLGCQLDPQRQQKPRSKWNGAFIIVLVLR